MAADTFFARWSKKKSDASGETDDLQQEQDLVATSLPAAHGNDEPVTDQEIATPSLPTLEDVEKLTHDSDFSAFMGKGVDESVKRSAMKKLFSDPHFNIMDGLDVYIDDYSKFEPISPALLASLNHAKALLNPLTQLQTPLMNLLEKTPPENSPTLDNAQPVQALDQTSPAIADGLSAEPVVETVLPDAVLENDVVQQQDIQNVQNEQNTQQRIDRTQQSSTSEPDPKERSASSRVRDV